MAITTVLAIYFIIWWVVLFTVLPWGARSQDESGKVTPGTDPGAPAVHRVWMKLVWTTVIASVVFVNLPNTKIELLEPLGEKSPIAAFLQRNPAGGIHHLCYEVADIRAARDKLKAAGARVLGDGEPKIGAHGKPVLFLHPKDFNGTLVELEQA